MLRQEYEELFGEQAMKDAGENVYDAFEFLEMLDAEGKFNTNINAVKARFLYHVPCHLKTQGIGTPAVSIFHSFGRLVRPCQRLPSSRSKVASARAHSASGSSGRHIACEQGRAST